MREKKKQCNKCLKFKKLGDFYFNIFWNRHRYSCKDCTREFQKKHWYSKYGRDEMRIIWNRASVVSQKKHPERWAARRAINNLLAAGKIRRGVCFCGNTKTEAHHKDYSKPLEITWLCGCHHRESHKKQTK